MLDSVKIARRQSEIRQTLSELVTKPAPTEDETRQMEALDAEYRSAAFMEANAITSPGGVNIGITPAIWAVLDEALIDGTAVSEWDRLVKHIGQLAASTVILAKTAILSVNVQGVPPGVLGLYGGVDLSRDLYTKAASWC